MVEKKETIGSGLSRFAKAKSGEVAKTIRPSNYDKYIEIIIPCYNHSAYLPKAFDSIVNQTYSKPIMVTFADDCSTDNTPNIIANIVSKRYKQITCNVIKNKCNLRQWGSLNNAIAKSNNKLIVILNDDDVLMPDCLEKIVGTYKQHSEIFMLGGSSLWIGSDGILPKHNQKPISKLKLTVQSPNEVGGYRELNDLNMTHSSCSFFKSAWEAAGGYRDKNDRIEERMTEDRDFQFRVNALFPVGVYYDYPLAYWREGTTHGHIY